MKERRGEEKRGGKRTCHDSDGSFDKGISGCHRRRPSSCRLCWLSSLPAVSVVVVVDEDEDWRTDLKKDVSASMGGNELFECGLLFL